MFDVKKYILALCCAAYCGGAAAQDLSGVATVNITSNTAAAAKNIAMDEARRQIISDVLGAYADRGQLAAAIKGATAADLNSVIAATGIDGEQLSDTTYSANITMTLDGAVAKKWLVDNNVQNWLGETGNTNNFIVSITFADPMGDWVDLKRIARELNLDFGAKSIAGGTALVELPMDKRQAFVTAVRGAGWKYSDVDGVLRIWR